MHLLVILLTARLFAEIAVRLNSPSVIGELFAGVLIGPSVLGWVEPVEAIKLLAEIGIILLLFEVGLGTDVKRLIHTGKKSTIIAISGFILPLLFGFAISYWLFELSLLISLFIGGTLTATSIGITVRVLTDIGLINCKEGRIVLGAAVLDDVLGVVLLALLYEFSVGGGVNFFNAGQVLIFITIFFLMAPVFAKTMSLFIKKIQLTDHVPGLIPTTIVSLVLFFAWLAHVIGAPELLGGFAAGLALSRRFFLPLGATLSADEDFAKLIEQKMQPIIYLFTPIFFVMVGLSVDFKSIDWSSSYIWSLSGSLFALAILGKIIGALLIRESLTSRYLIGISMVPRGEVGLVFTELGHFSGIFNNEIHAALVIVIVVTTILPPYIIKWIHKKHSHNLALPFNN